ncbi:MAG: vitamin K epoxide reductase family protein [Desulforhopalus sp.]
MTPVQQQTSRLSAQTYYYIIVILIFAGLVTSLYLSLAHYWNYTDLGYQSFCAISRTLNCDTVAQSPFSIYLGLPVANWGVIGYAFLFILSLAFKPSKNCSPGFSLLCLLTGLFSLASTVLAAISFYIIKSYCILCMFSYGINYCLFLLTWMSQKRFGGGAFVEDLKKAFSHLALKRSKTMSICAVFTCIIYISLVFYPKYWILQSFPNNQRIDSGVTDDHHPWIGAKNPTLTIVEFSDYMCFQCSKMHNHLRQLVSRYPEKLRVVHRHFPLDHHVNPLIKDPVHPNSGLLSMFSIIAQEADVFWPVNDILFRDAREKGQINFSDIARETGIDLTNLQILLNDKRLISRLMSDIRTGIHLGITSTPSYLINNKVYSGSIPEDIFAPLLERN